MVRFSLGSQGLQTNLRLARNLNKQKTMLLRGFLWLLEFSIILDVVKSFPVQQEPVDGASVKSALEQGAYEVPGDQGSGGTEYKTAPNPMFPCFDLGICRTGLDFCHPIRKACEKCEDYEHTCGSNIQPVNCTKYCVDLLVAKKLQEREKAITSVSTEKPPESKEKTIILDLKWIWIVIGILVLIIIALLVFIGWRECKRKRSTTTEKTETQLELLRNDAETSIEEPNLTYSSVPPQYDNGSVNLPIPSAPSMSREIYDQNQTKPKMKGNPDKYLPSKCQEPKIGELNGGKQQAVEAPAQEKSSAEIQHREAEDDEPASSGYSSTVSTPDRSRQGSASVTNTITINVNPNVPNITSTSTVAKTTQLKDPDKNVPFGKQESSKMESAISLDVPYTNQLKPVSDENTNAQIVLRDNAFDITDDKNEPQKIN